MSYSSLLQLAAPEVILSLTALAVLLADLTALRGFDTRLRRRIGALAVCAGCVVTIAWLLAIPAAGEFDNGMLVVDPVTRLVQVGLVGLALCAVLLTVESSFTQHVGEYYAVLLFATVGMMFMAGAADMLTAFLALELASLSLYVLAAFNKTGVAATEAALKYFLFGGVAAAFTLFGLSLLYGISGSTNLAEVARVVAARAVHLPSALDGVAVPSLDPLLLVAIAMTTVGFGFKLAVVPFHAWAPDTYQAAPGPAAAFIASASKLASFFLFARVLEVGLAGAEGSPDWLAVRPGWMALLAVIAAASMIWGNLAAIRQQSVRRLLAYSAVAHAGYMVLGLFAPGPDALASLLYYALTYGLTVVGAFAVVGVVQGGAERETMADFAGFARREPWLAASLMVFLLSLAGVPPLPGFFGKFYLFGALLRQPAAFPGKLWLVVLAVAMSTVSLYYYLKVLKQALVVPALAERPVVECPAFSRVVIVGLAIAVVVLGAAPGLVVAPLLKALAVASW